MPERPLRPVSLSISPIDASRIFLGGAAPEESISAILELWKAQALILTGAVYLRRPSGWSRVVHADGAAAATEKTPTLRLLCEPSLPESSVEGVDARWDGACGAFGLKHRDDEVARLVVEVPDESTGCRLSTELFVQLSMFVGALRDRELLDAVAFQGGYCRRMLGSQAPGSAMDEDVAKDFPEIVSRSNRLAEVLQIVRRSAGRDVSILIEGESGTGKELIGQAIHRLSLRASGPFTSENCAALTETLMEAELFGHEKGAFTGATESRAGLIEQADGGTLFLDEIGEMSPGLQSKLLRVLQEREVRRVGGTRRIPVDFRLISATHRDLDLESREGRFRLDLLYRIQVIRIKIPPLRERTEDIPLLVHHFLREFSNETGAPMPEVHEEAMRMLCAHNWPGNVRELRNEIERAFTLTPDLITPESLSPKVESQLLEPSLAKRVREQLGANIYGLERMLIGGVIREVLRETGGNKTETARILGIPKSNLYRRLRKYGLD